MFNLTIHFKVMYIGSFPNTFCSVLVLFYSVSDQQLWYSPIYNTYHFVYIYYNVCFTIDYIVIVNNIVETMQITKQSFLFLSQI